MRTPVKPQQVASDPDGRERPRTSDRLVHAVANKVAPPVRHVPDWSPRSRSAGLFDNPILRIAAFAICAALLVLGASHLVNQSWRTPQRDISSNVPFGPSAHFDPAAAPISAASLPGNGSTSSSIAAPPTSAAPAPLAAPVEEQAVERQVQLPQYNRDVPTTSENERSAADIGRIAPGATAIDGGANVEPAEPPKLEVPVASNRQPPPPTSRLGRSTQSTVVRSPAMGTGLAESKSEAEVIARQCRSLEQWKVEVERLAAARSDAEAAEFKKTQDALIVERQRELRCGG